MPWQIFSSKKPQVEDVSLHTMGGSSPQPCATTPTEVNPLLPAQKSKQDAFQTQKLIAMRFICSPHNISGDEKSSELLKAIQKGKTADVACMLEDYSTNHLNRITFSGQNLLHYLIWKQDLEVLRIVLKKGAETNLFNIDGITPLHLAILESWQEGAEELLSHGASVNLPPESTCSSFGFKNEAPILMALRIGDIPTIFTLLESNPDLTSRDEINNSVLHIAASTRSFPLLDQLLNRGGHIINDIFSQNDYGETCLHSLFLKKSVSELEEVEIIECVQILLLHGAEVDAIDSFTQTPLYLACRRGLPNAANVLLSSGADPTIKSFNGRTVLHAACRAGSPETLSFLLKAGRTDDFVLTEDSRGMTPFHLAVNSYSMECCEILLENGDHLTEKDSQGESRCSLALRNMPKAKQFFRKIFNKHMHRENEIEDAEFSINLDFSVLLPKCDDDVDDSIISEIYDSEAESLLKHPLVESFIFFKWNRLRFFFYSYAIIYLCFLSLHTFFVIKTYGMETNWSKEQATLRTVRCLLIIILLLLIIPGTITLFANFSKFLKQFETYFKIIALLTASYIVFSHNDKDLSSKVSIHNDLDAERNIAAISIFFTWIEFMMLLGRFPSLGIYILMFTRVAKSIITFLMAFSSLLVAFSLTFSILLNNSKILVFNSFPVGFVKTLMMMIGEIDYSDIYEDIMGESKLTIIISHIFLVAFLFLIPILMANLLIGLAVNDLPDLQKHGKIRSLVKEASYIISYERITLLFKKMFCIPSGALEILMKRCRIPRQVNIYPNKCRKKFKKLFHIPHDALEEAIGITAGESRTIDQSHLQLEDLQYAFLELFQEFREDKKKTENKLADILNALSCNGDTVDSPRKGKRKFPSWQNHRN